MHNDRRSRRWRPCRRARDNGAPKRSRCTRRPISVAPTKCVTGIVGVFFKSKDSQALAAWYKTHLGVNVLEWGGAAFEWKSPDNPEGVGTMIWRPFAADTAAQRQEGPSSFHVAGSPSASLFAGRSFQTLGGVKDISVAHAVHR